MDFSNYFSDNSLPLEISFITLLFELIVSIVIIVLFIKAYRRLKENLPNLNNVKSYLIALLGLVVLNIGNLISNIVIIFTNGEKTFFLGVDNFFYPLGFSLSITFFVIYLISILKSRRIVKDRRKLINLSVIAFIMASILTNMIMIIRFIMISFMPTSFSTDTIKITALLIIILISFVLIVLVASSLLIYLEYKETVSNFNRSRLKIYMGYTISIFASLLAIVAVIILTFGDSSYAYVSGLATAIFSLSAALSLYYGMFMPKWIQRKMGLLPDF